MQEGASGLSGRDCYYLPYAWHGQKLYEDLTTFAQPTVGP